MASLATWMPVPTLYEVVRFFGIFAATITGCYIMSIFAWRQALRDTNGDKRRRILESLGVRERRNYLFVGFLHVNR